MPNKARLRNSAYCHLFLRSQKSAITLRPQLAALTDLREKHDKNNNDVSYNRRSNKFYSSNRCAFFSKIGKLIFN